MNKKHKILVENNMIIERREINIYHHSRTRTFLHNYDNAVAIDLKSTDEFDYIHLSIVKGPWNLQNECLIKFPDKLDLELSTNNLHGCIHFIQSGHKTLLKIPPGSPNWEVKIRNQNCLSSDNLENVDHIFFSSTS